MSKKIIITKCLGCPKAHYFTPNNIIDSDLKAWCGLLGKMIPIQVLLGHKLWSECKLENDND